jgi:hypothetical protein
VTLLLDPMDDLLDSISRIEDWLRWADPDDDITGVVDTGITTAGDLRMALRAAKADTPRLQSPTGGQLALLIPLPSEPVAEAHEAIAAAATVLTRQRPAPDELSATLALIRNCLYQDGSSAALQLAAVMNGKGSGSRWLALEGEDDRAGTRPEEIGTGTRRWAAKLTGDEFGAYQRYCSAVIDDPLLRFAATGQ